MRNEDLNWDNANAWEVLANANKEPKYNEPHWSFDCNFKLDFDGPLLSINSRFYPPHKNNHDGWEGSVSVFLNKQEIERKTFITRTVDELKTQVEEYVNKLQTRIVLRKS